MSTQARFRVYQPDQLLLLPPALQDWLPEGHLANSISDVVDTLDLSEIIDSYDNSAGGQAPFSCG
jgi:transposase